MSASCFDYTAALIAVKMRGQFGLAPARWRAQLEEIRALPEARLVAERRTSELARLIAAKQRRRGEPAVITAAIRALVRRRRPRGPLERYCFRWMLLWGSLGALGVANVALTPPFPIGLASLIVAAVCGWNLRKWSFRWWLVRELGL